MYLFRAVFVLIVLVFCNMTAYAEWIRVGSGIDDVYLDFDSATYTENTVVFWHLSDFKNTKEGTWTSAKSKAQINCKLNIFNESTVLLYEKSMAQGSMIRSNSLKVGEQEYWRDIVPGSTFSVFQKVLCMPMLKIKNKIH